jgi:riboflavin biosynthesis pyrimidine reductase
MRAHSRSSVSSHEPLQMRRLITIDDHASRWPVTPIGNDWTRAYYDGPFYVFDPPEHRPAVSLVFVQSRNGNTAADNPSELGGGPTDKHLIYEGLSRVAADGVLAGAATVGHSVFFSVTHPQLVALRRDLGLPRHPAQIVLSEEGRIDFSSRVFSTPEVPVFLLAGAQCVHRCSMEVRRRPWINMVPTNGHLPGTLTTLRREYGINRISAVGGRNAATSLVDADLVQDIYLTTSAIDAGEPNTPWYVGKSPPALSLIVRKREDTTEQPILFEHLAIERGRD